MKKLKCPKCSSALEPVEYEGIEVDRCTECKGIWFDALEAHRLKSMQGSENLDVGDPLVGSQFNESEGKIHCPRCNIAMLQWMDIDNNIVVYERCPACNGLWLDAGEFRAFKDNFKNQGLKAIANSLLNRE